MYKKSKGIILYFNLYGLYSGSIKYEHKNLRLIRKKQKRKKIVI